MLQLFTCSSKLLTSSLAIIKIRQHKIDWSVSDADRVFKDCMTSSSDDGVLCDKLNTMWNHDASQDASQDVSHSMYLEWKANFRFINH